MSIKNSLNSKMRYIMEYIAIYVILVMCFVGNQAEFCFDQHKSRHCYEDNVYSEVSPHILIQNGQAAKKGQFPYAATVLLVGFFRHGFCGGSLINKRWILTAAHCYMKFKVKYASIKLGGIHGTGNEKGSITLTSITAIMHKKFDSIRCVNDITLIKLPQDIKFTSVIRPILLPRRAHSRMNLINSMVMVCGWGLTSDKASTRSPNDQLMYTYLYILPSKRCQKCLPATAFCALGPSNQSTCYGDSGGPVILLDRNNEVLIGITSYSQYEICAAPTVYTRIDHYLDWIHRHTGIPIRS